jgi:hypothetical protein
MRNFAMRCEQANLQLVEYAEDQLAAETALAIEAHLSACPTCQDDYAAITQWRGMADQWHEEIAPDWQPPQVAPGALESFIEGFRQWFPTFASTAALVLVAVIFIQQPTVTGVLPSGQLAQANYAELPPLPKATQAAMVERVLASSRTERGEELQALLKVLKAEMDKRSIETEASLRYIITHQIQGQEEIEDLYKQVEALMQAESSADNATNSHRNETVAEGVIQ